MQVTTRAELNKSMVGTSYMKNWVSLLPKFASKGRDIILSNEGCFLEG